MFTKLGKMLIEKTNKKDEKIQTAAQKGKTLKEKDSK